MKSCQKIHTIHCFDFKEVVTEIIVCGFILSRRWMDDYISRNCDARISISHIDIFFSMSSRRSFVTGLQGTIYRRKTSIKRDTGRADQFRVYPKPEARGQRKIQNRPVK